MKINPRNKSLLILGLSSLVLSKVFFTLFSDPEGPNLLIVTVMAGILYGIAFAVYSLHSSKKSSGLKNILFPICIQILVILSLYFLLK